MPARQTQILLEWRSNARRQRPCRERQERGASGLRALRDGDSSAWTAMLQDHNRCTARDRHFLPIGFRPVPVLTHPAPIIREKSAGTQIDASAVDTPI